jgi:hypothetical protein
VAGEIDAVGVVNEPVEDGVGISRVANEGVPFVDRDLAGEDGRAAPIAFLETGSKWAMVHHRQEDYVDLTFSVQLSMA